jgi:DNA helicase HerA-like ATPase
MMNTSLDPLLAKSEKIGVIGSPSSTAELALEILGAAVGRKLVGELALFRFLQDNAPHFALGQITEVTLRNLWHEDATMRSLIRQRGRVDAVSERQDTHQGVMTISAVFAHGTKSYEPSMLGTVPCTGTNVQLISDDVLDELLAAYRNQLFYLGTVYGSRPRLPLWFKHFDRGPDGAGEAYHLGIFGKTGSGKSVLAKMILCAYARYPKMALLVIDPQGEFAKDLRGNPSGEFALPLGGILRSLGKTPAVLSVKNLVLDTWDLFEQVIYESLFLDRLTLPRGDNRRIAAELLGERLKKAQVTLAELHSRAAFDRAWSILKDEKTQKGIYKSPEPRARFDSVLAESDPEEFFREYWSPAVELFREDRKNARTVDKALKWLFARDTDTRPILIVDLSREQAAEMFWNEKIQALVIKRLLFGVTFAAERAFKDEIGLNTLVVIDEAHRLAPRQVPEDADDVKAVRGQLIDAVRTTRKYGLGWLFISQTLSSLHQEILQQLRISFFGFGLGLGTEFMALRDLVGGKSPALDLYRLFRDPHSAFDMATRSYSFMTIGPVSPLSFSGTPLFLNAYNTVGEFIRQNSLSPK